MIVKKHMVLPLVGLSALIVGLLSFTACSSSSGGGVSIGPNDPFAGLAVSQTVQTGGKLQYPVEVVRDTYGIPHIYGRTITDIAYVQGYVQASDRLFEMDMFRHIGDGTLTEYLGNLPGVVDADVHDRVLGFSSVAATVFSQATPRLQSILQSFCNGVNAYLAYLQQQVQKNPGAKVLP